MSFSVKLGNARDPLVLAIDVGSTATRAALYDAAGHPISPRVKLAHHFTTESDGTVIIDADQVVGEICSALDQLTDVVSSRSIAGVAIDTFAACVVGTDAAGQAITPLYTYADSRCAAQVSELRHLIDETELQQRTGTRIHSSYLVPRLRWLRATDPNLFGRVHKWLSLSEYVYLQLLGTTVAGTASAAWTGMLNRRTGQWDEQCLELADISVEQLAVIHDPDQPIRPSSDFVAKRWPLLANALWFPGIGDGLAANLGAGALDDTKMVASAATSGAMRVLATANPEHLPPGLWCYRVDARRCLLGGALNDVGRALTWLQSALALPEDSSELINAAVIAAPKPNTPKVLPFFSGERSVGWAANARAALVGVSAATTPSDLIRGTFEGVTWSYSRVSQQLQTIAENVAEIRVAGRVLAEIPGLLPLLANALDKPVRGVQIKRATLHGTALLALESLAPDGPRAEVDLGPVVNPNPDYRGYFDSRAAELAALYELLI